MITDTATSLLTRIAAKRFADRNALVDSSGRFTCSELLAAAISWRDRPAAAAPGDRACEFGAGAPASIWDRLASGRITLFMSVPTVYTRLIRAWQAAAAPVRGPQVFREYRGRPADTAAAFRDGWFRTGDEGCIGAGGYFRILGRRSVDIVKTGGYKVSALEVEEVYRTHPAVRNVAVVGVPHAEWGERLSAAWVPLDGQAAPAGAEMRAWGKERLAPYKVPHRFLAVSGLPRNAMGKVQKADVSRMFTV